MNNHTNNREVGLPAAAKHLIAFVSAVGSLVVMSSLVYWSTGSLTQLAAWAILAAVAGAVKLRFPKFETSYSGGSIVILAALGVLGFSEIIALGAIIALAQCYWRPLKRPTGVQVAFNVSNFAVSSACAWLVLHALKHSSIYPGFIAPFGLSAAVFFLVNSGLVAWIISILSKQEIADVFEKSFLLIFPCYVVGAAYAGAVASSNRGDWAVLMLSLPIMALLYKSTQAWVRKLA